MKTKNVKSVAVSSAVRAESVIASAIRNVVIFSDTHIGCMLALCHPGGAELDDGGMYKPSKIQQKIWNIWEEFWGEWVPRATHNEPYIVVFNGDGIDGIHHNSTTQWTHNLEFQKRHCEKIFRPIVEKCEGRFFWIRGTEAHVGKSATDEESLAKELGPRKIRVTAVNPGMIETEGVHAVGIAEGDFRKMVESQTPLGRIGQPDDVAPAVVFFASDDARWITGATLEITGGFR